MVASGVGCTTKQFSLGAVTQAFVTRALCLYSMANVRGILTLQFQAKFLSSYYWVVAAFWSPVIYRFSCSGGVSSIPGAVSFIGHSK